LGEQRFGHHDEPPLIWNWLGVTTVAARWLRSTTTS
jgi:hypothetical protein